MAQTGVLVLAARWALQCCTGAVWWQCCRGVAACSQSSGYYHCYGDCVHPWDATDGYLRVLTRGLLLGEVPVSRTWSRLVAAGPWRHAAFVSAHGWAAGFLLCFAFPRGEMLGLDTW